MYWAWYRNNTRHLELSYLELHIRYLERKFILRERRKPCYLEQKVTKHFQLSIIQARSWREILKGAPSATCEIFGCHTLYPFATPLQSPLNLHM